MDTQNNEHPMIQVDGEAAATLDGMDDVHELLDRYWNKAADAHLGPPDSAWRGLFDSAVAEIAGNIVRHAFPPPLIATTFQISLRYFADRVEAIMLDRGIPYSPVPVLDLPDMRLALDDPELDHGWGLMIAHAVADNLDYERLGDGYNRWHIEKRLPS